MEKNIEFCTGTHQGFGQLTLELVNLWVGLGGGGGLGWGSKGSCLRAKYSNTSFHEKYDCMVNVNYLYTSKLYGIVYHFFVRFMRFS